MLEFSLVIAVISVILLVAGIAYPIYSFPDDYYDRRQNTFQNKAGSYIQKLEREIAPSKDGIINKALFGFIKRADAQISLQRLWLYKLSCILLTFIILTTIAFTNTSILRENIMGSWWKDKYFMETISSEEYKYNVTLYKEVLRRIGEKNLQNLGKEQKVSTVSGVLRSFNNDNGQVGEMASALVSAYEDSENIRVVTFNIILASLLAFFIPETILVLKKLIVSKKYKREAIKMQNILGLLGSIENYKTINILKDMAKASNIFSTQFNHAATIFYTDKNKCFEYMKESIKDSSFNKLTEILRIYSTVDRTLAMSVLERNLKEQEEQLILSAEEDMDLVDILAFMSVVPILYEIANLMLNPMMDMVFQAFNFM